MLGMDMMIDSLMKSLGINKEQILQSASQIQQAAVTAEARLTALEAATLRNEILLRRVLALLDPSSATEGTDDNDRLQHNGIAIAGPDKPN